jgi:hypothetical protein
LSGYYYTLDENKNVVECDMHEYASSIDKNREVKIDIIKGTTISTVFLGLKHPGGTVFETMLFSDDTKLHGEMMRYKTYNEALNGHAKHVIYVAKHLGYYNNIKDIKEP